MVAGNILGVSHGEYMVDAAACRRCRCNDGSLEDCEPSRTCRSIQLSPTSCTYEDQIIRHGDSFEVQNS